MIGYVLAALNLIAFVLIWRQGTGWDRVAVIILAVLIVAGAFVWRWQIDGWRVGSAILSFATFGALMIPTERHERWWLVFCSSFQLMIAVTYLVPFIVPERTFQMTGYVIRQGLWGVITLLLFAAAWECWAARKLAQEMQDVRHLQGGV